MSKLKNEITDEIVLRKIYQLRGKNIMLDSDLAELYGVSTTRLNEQVKRNMQRFPEDFMFQITKKEKEWLYLTTKTQLVLKTITSFPARWS